MRMRLAMPLAALMAAVLPVAVAAPGHAAAADGHHKHQHKQHHHKHQHHHKQHHHKQHRNQRTPAFRISVRIWDAIAACESGGDWHIDTGNGYYGGLQISPSTWAGYGGGKYASVPSRASKDEQIVVAERIQAGQGWGAWPTCSARAGV